MEDDDDTEELLSQLIASQQSRAPADDEIGCCVDDEIDDRSAEAEASSQQSESEFEARNLSAIDSIIAAHTATVAAIGTGATAAEDPVRRTNR